MPQGRMICEDCGGSCVDSRVCRKCLRVIWAERKKYAEGLPFYLRPDDPYQPRMRRGLFVDCEVKVHHPKKRAKAE